MLDDADIDDSAVSLVTLSRSDISIELIELFSFSIISDALLFEQILDRLCSITYFYVRIIFKEV